MLLKKKLSRSDFPLVDQDAKYPISPTLKKLGMTAIKHIKNMRFQFEENGVWISETKYEKGTMVREMMEDLIGYCKTLSWTELEEVRLES